MKKIIYLIAISTILVSCKFLIQVNETKSSNTEKKNGFFVYEDDTLSITYSFWAERGVLSFDVYNKLNVPIYLDWKKSSFIDNSDKFNYWFDEEISSAIAYYGGFYYSGQPLNPRLSISYNTISDNPHSNLLNADKKSTSNNSLVTFKSLYLTFFNYDYFLEISYQPVIQHYTDCK